MLVPCDVCTLPRLQAGGAEENPRLFSPLFGFHAQVLLNATCFAKFGDVRPFEGMMCAMLAHVSRQSCRSCLHRNENLLSVRCAVLQG